MTADPAFAVSTGTRPPWTMVHMPIDQDPWPKDRTRATSILACIVREIATSDDDYRETLLYEFMQTAWPTQWAQSQ